MFKGVKKMSSRAKSDFKRASQVEEGSLVEAIKDLYRMLFPKKR